MAITLCVFSGTVNNGATEEIAFVNDGVIASSGNYAVADRDLYAVAAAVISANADRGYLRAGAALTELAFPVIRPVTQGTTFPTDPNLALWLDDPILLEHGREIGIRCAHNGGAPETMRCFLWVSDGLVPEPDGGVITVRATSTTAATANAWSDVTLTWEGWPPASHYALVGSEVISTTGLAHRWVTDSQVFRPGALSMTSAANRSHEYFYSGNMGQWAVIREVMPRLQVFCTAGDTAHTVYAQFIKMR
jgi:hypothetical protein